MRRMEGDARGAPPFRVLGDTGGHVYVVASPPPTLAPEPYKIATSMSSNNRVRRRSSFVIIAEARPATPTSRSPSPSLATGRSSPFRGRGFKGPLPHAQSRPQTPEAKDTRRAPRIDRRMSTSQQNSPKRSLIPQPARRRSVSLSKTAENGKNSPKYGRRATSKNHLEVTQVAPGRRASLKVPGLSPIQGTPTKPQDKKAGQNSLAKKTSPLKTARRNSTLPPSKGGGRPAPILKTKPPSKSTNSKTQEQPTSPSKIPVKRGSISDLKGAPASRQNSRRGSLAKISTPKNGEKIEKPTREKPEQKEQKDSKPAAGKKTESSGPQQNASKKTDPKPKAQPTSSKEVGNDVVEGKEPHLPSKDEPSLMELLKQSSGASGTSSVVNTTTVTAAQPLQIDAVALVDSEVHKIIEKEAEVKRRNPDSGRKNGVARPTAINVPSSNSDSYFSPKTEDGVNEVMTSEGNSFGERNRHQKTESGTQGSVRSTVASAKSNASNAERLNTNSSNVGKTLSNETGLPNMSPDSYGQSANNVQGLQPTGGGQHRTSADANHRTHEMMKEKDSAVTDTLKSSDVHSISMKGSLGSGDNRATPTSTTRSVIDERIVTPVNLVASSDRVYSPSAMVNNVKHLQDDLQHMGSAASLKSTAGLSTGSTDTGVSVNTVRGVSSAREKRGMHMVKQPQGIETLSGNVVHLEQNGEPVVPGARPSDHQGEDQDQDRVGSVEVEKSRWKRILNRCCGCCKCNCNCCDHGRAMRCLACRRGFKPQMNRPQPMNQDTSKEQSGCLSKLKTSSRCCRMPNWKGCARGSRVAPAEEGGCCPPERRCGAIFWKFCSRCACKRQDAPQQIRNVQAKQSLTSIAAPVLPEEPKSKLPEVLVEHNAPMRGAIPCLPIPLAWFCLVWNVLLPGTGTFWSGLFNLCVGQPRFSAVATPRARLGAFLVNTVVGVGQMFTVLFCLVGWGWSIWWGVMMVRLARKYKRFRDSEAANNDVEARGGGETSTVPPGVPNQASRGYERAR